MHPKTALFLLNESLIVVNVKFVSPSASDWKRRKEYSYFAHPSWLPTELGENIPILVPAQDSYRIAWFSRESSIEELDLEIEYKYILGPVPYLFKRYEEALEHLAATHREIQRQRILELRLLAKQKLHQLSIPDLNI